MCPSRICSFRRSLPQLGTRCNLRIQRTFQGSLGAHAFLIWEMPATDPSRKCRFRRSLPHLGTACNLRFFACIHTSAFIKKNLKKTRFDPFSAIWAATEASKAPFFAELHPSHNAYAETRENCPKNDFLAGAKISAARVTYPESFYTSYTFLRKRSKLVRS